jgi:predicted DNA binding CopG/RHH family protein
MSEFSDFVTMKLIEQRRLENHPMSRNFESHLFESMKLNKNINVRTPVDLIARIEVLANHFGVSKAELVTEMLESSLMEALKLIEKEGWLDTYLNGVTKHLESNYGFKFEYDENEKATKVIFPESKEDPE